MNLLPKKNPTTINISKNIAYIEKELASDTDVIRRSDAIKAFEKRIVEDTIIYQKKIPNSEEVSLLASEIFTDIPAVEPNLILPERMERGEVYDVGETITVMNHEDYMEMFCKAMMWDEYGEEPKKGKWIHRSYYRASTGMYDCEVYVCNRCRNEYSYDAETGISADSFHFCPHCGEPMERADE